MSTAACGRGRFAGKHTARSADECDMETTLRRLASCLFTNVKFLSDSVLRISNLSFLFRQPVEHVHRLNRRTRLAEGAEPALVDRRDPARTVEPGQRAVYSQSKCRVIASQHESIGFVGEQNIRQSEARRIFRSHREPDQNATVRGE